MSKLLARATLLLTALLAASTLSAFAYPAPAQAASYSAPLRTAVASLSVAAEIRTGYDRDLFQHWIDADGDGCNTRYEILIAEATTAPSVGSGCTLTGGRWFSYYDGATWTQPSDLDIDHFVPLAESWDSGSRNWTSTQRRNFANDLGDSRSLIAVTDDVNQAKGDKDPREWLPPLSSVRCRYITEWVAVKIRWRLTVDSAEKSTLTSLANGCSNVTVSVTYAI
ncbi:MAG TPA: HNH endonuclease family protein [Phytomonospora sp.]